MENVTTNNQSINETPKRPQFLTVLCILTFIGCAFALIGAVMGYFSAQASSAMLGNMSAEGNEAMGMMAGMDDVLRKAVENALPNLIIGIVCALLCLFGALQMWKLKKMGFYVYAVGEITPAIAAFILGGGGMIGGLGAAFGLLIAVVWIILYAVNLKHMN